MHCTSRCLAIRRIRVPSQMWTASLYGAVRLQSSTPSNDEICKAFKCFDLPRSAPFADIRKKYITLAKEHHPDVKGGANSKNQTMASINESYDVLSRAHKAGSLGQGTSSSSQGAQSSSSYGYGTGRPNVDPNEYHQEFYEYQPLWDDLPPEFHEAMWQQMRHGDMGGMPQDHGFQAQRRHHKHQRQHQRQQSSQNQSNGSTNNKSQRKEEPPKKSVTWPEADLQALCNMYQDGKSFEFIANALGRKQPDVVAEFNRWYNDNKKPQHRNQNQHRNGNKKRRPNVMGYDGPWPQMEFEDIGEYLDPDEYGDPIDAGMYYDVDEGAQPFSSGKHYMHRGGRGGHFRPNYRR